MKLLPLFSAVLIILLPAAFPTEAAPLPDCSAMKKDEEKLTCQKAHAKEAEEALEAVETKLLVNTGDDDKQRSVLREAHAKWSVWRDAQCAADMYDSVQGNVYDLYLSQCLEGMTRERTAKLEKLIPAPKS